mmetsp:Transcript_16043/g.20772  ORF Transcript_16043/g.20772 Transcript_16043/m.20772 type:complete len:438 (+) Transcript_16043:33-1346(+)
MGQAALEGKKAEDALPNPVPEAQARLFVGKCWDDADWATISQGNPTCSKDVLLTTMRIRDHAPSLRSWLEHWRIDELHDKLVDLEIMCADDLVDIDKKTLGDFVNSLKPVQKYHWEKAYAHGLYLASHPLGYMPWRPEGLMMWLESWRLQRLQPALFDLGVDVKEDIMDLREEDYGLLNLRLLEEKRWLEGVASLKNLVKTFSYASQRKASIPTIKTWLKSLRLERVEEQIIAHGAQELVDLADVDEKQMAEMNLTKLQTKHWKVGMNQIWAARREAMADGKADLSTFRGYLESWRLLRLMPQLDALGATVQQDLLDLDPNEYGLIEMRPLEAKRFEQMMIALEEEFETPPPGEEWTEENMTRRAWRGKTKKQMKKTMGNIPEDGSYSNKGGRIEASKTLGASKMERARANKQPGLPSPSGSVSSTRSDRRNFRQTR